MDAEVCVMYAVIILHGGAQNCKERSDWLGVTRHARLSIFYPAVHICDKKLKCFSTVCHASFFDFFFRP